MLALLTALLLLTTVEAQCHNSQCWINELNTAAPAPLQRFVEVACTAASAIDPATLTLTATLNASPAGAAIPLSACLP